MHHKHKKLLIIIITAILVLIAGIAALMYFKAYPVAVVGDGLISRKYWDQAHSIAKKIDPSVSDSVISDQIIKVKKEQLLTGGGKIDDEFAFTTSGNHKQYSDFLNKYFLSDENLFREFVVKPQFYEAKLQIEYNSDLKANQAAYARAQDLLSKLKSGKSFEELAKTDSDEKVSGQLGGDLGFITEDQILPELKWYVKDAQIGKIIPKILISRVGYHILYPVETSESQGTKTWHIKNILIRTSGFDSWLQKQLDSIWVWRIK